MWTRILEVEHPSISQEVLGLILTDRAYPFYFSTILLEIKYLITNFVRKFLIVYNVNFFKVEIQSGEAGFLHGYKY